MLCALMFVATLTARAAQYDYEIMSATASTSVTGTTATADMVGELLELVVTVPSAKTCTVAVATADGVTLFSKAACVGTAVYRPRFDVHSYAGAALGSGTEAISLTEASYLTGTSTNAAHAITGTIGFGVYEPAVVIGTLTATFTSANTTGVVVNVKALFRK
jgi:hypothetical protein